MIIGCGTSNSDPPAKVPRPAQAPQPHSSTPRASRLTQASLPAKPPAAAARLSEPQTAPNTPNAQLDASPQAVTAPSDLAAQHETWGSEYQSAADCDDYRTSQWPHKSPDNPSTKRVFGYEGYLYQRVAVTRNIDGVERTHCVRIYFPPASRTAAGKTVRIIDYIKPSWFRVIENTMQRLPWLHLQLVKAIVIDDRPTLHGIASYSRRDPSKDARDGHTIWLNKRLFLEPNGFVTGNYGTYWAYRLSEDGQRASSLAPDHELFSPVLIHEIGHLVMYHRVNGKPWDVSCPACSRMCGDHGNCADLSQYEREAYCVTPYCTGFGYSSGTENFAEMYRWYYQSELTRGWLSQHYGACHALFARMDGGLPAPWQRGLSEVHGYRVSRWDSCRAKAPSAAGSNRCNIEPCNNVSNLSTTDWARRCR